MLTKKQMTRIEALKKVILDARNEIDAMEEDETMLVRRSQVGLMFKQIHTHSQIIDINAEPMRYKKWKWPVYVKITGLSKDGYLVGFRFGMCPSDGRISIEPEICLADHEFYEGNGHTGVGPAEYSSACRALCNRLSEILGVQAR